MSTRRIPTRPSSALLQRLLRAVLMLAFMLGGFGTLHVAEASPSRVEIAAVAAISVQDVGADEGSSQPEADAVPAHHVTCGSHAAAPARSDLWSAVIETCPAVFQAAAQHALRPGLFAPLAKPPRT